MGNTHTHTHQHGSHTHENNSARLVASILFNLIITLAEIVGGVLSGSLALLSDALHNFSDTTSLVISLVTLKISIKSPDHKKTFGYRRAQIVGALINLVSLVLVSFYLIKEALERYFNPQPIQGTMMLVVALIGLAANLLTAIVLLQPSKKSLNIRSAFFHIIGDAVSSVGVVISGLLIIRYRLYFTDTLVTLIISAYILVNTFKLLKQTINILMQGVPEGFNLERVIDEVKHIDNVIDIHHVHVWQLDENHANLEAHVVIDRTDPQEMNATKQSIKQRLAEHFNITHSTLELEFHNCDGTSLEDCYEIHTHKAQGAQAD